MTNNMNLYDILLLIGIAALVAGAVTILLIRRKNGTRCGCGGGSGCSGCTGCGNGSGCSGCASYGNGSGCREKNTPCSSK